MPFRAFFLSCSGFVEKKQIQVGPVRYTFSFELSGLLNLVFCNPIPLSGVLMPIAQPQYWPRILRMAMPIVIAMLTQTAINILDTVMVGWLEPSYAVAGQAALGFSTPMLWLFGGFLSSISIGTLAIVARRQGEKNYPLAGAALTNAVTVAVIASLVVSTLAYIFTPEMFRLFIDNDAVISFGVPYARLRLLGVLSMVTTAAIKSFFDGTNRTYVHMVAAIVMNIANIVLNYCFIFGPGPFPGLNVAGAGLASLVATYIGLAIMIGWSLVPSIRKKYQSYHPSTINGKTIWDIVRVSVPSGIANIFVMTGFLIFFKIVGILDVTGIEKLIHSLPAYAGDSLPEWTAAQNAMLDTGFGTNSLWTADLSFAMIQAHPPIYSSTSNLCVSIMSVVFMGAMAFGTATASLVSQSLGEKKPDVAQNYAFESAKVAGILFACLGVLLLTIPEKIVALFSNVDEVIEVTAGILRLLSPGAIIIACALIFTQSLFGAGCTKFVMCVEGSLHFLCLIPLSYLLGIVLDLGILGMWGAVLIYATALAIIMFVKLKAGGWKKIQL